MNLRFFGSSGIALSPLTLGPMRMDPAKLDPTAIASLMSTAYAAGITTVHCSHEYDSNNLFMAGLKEFRKDSPTARLTHIVKLAAPHFHEDRFSKKSFINSVDRYLQDLDIERIEVVQWLVRSNPIDDAPRLAILRSCREEFSELWDQLLRLGKVGVMGSFPYTPAFADEILSLPFCSGLITYFNAIELDFLPQLKRAQSFGKGVIAIRPLAAGKLLQPKNAITAKKLPRLRAAIEYAGGDVTDALQFALSFPLYNPNVCSVIVGLSSPVHAQSAGHIGATVKPNAVLFEKLCAILNAKEGSLFNADSSI